MAYGRFSKVIAAAAVALLLLSCSGDVDDGDKATGDTAAENGSSIEGQAVEENQYKGSVAGVTFRTLDGGEKKIADYGGKILMVNYLATWNEDSKKLVPIMNEVQRKFHANVIVLGVITDSSSAGQARAFGENNNVKFELLLSDGNSGRFGRPNKLPISHVVTRKGYLLSSFEGLFEAKKYEKMILAMYRRRM